MGPFHDNRAGRERGRRMFLLFGSVLLAIWLLFVALSLSSPTVGVSGDAAVYAALTVIALLLGAVGWALTLGRAPQGFWERDGDLVIRENFGRRRRLPGPPMLTVRVVQRYPAGFLGPAPAELVELSAPGEGRRAYLVGREFFPVPPQEP